uniref:SCP domain-containing protein n=1 Tax=Heterorhabditis bacteriophora TaxID=37862 RepID=A0A1I7WHH4_HETBA
MRFTIISGCFLFLNQFLFQDLLSEFGYHHFALKVPKIKKNAKTYRLTNISDNGLNKMCPGKTIMSMTANWRDMPMIGLNNAIEKWWKELEDVGFPADNILSGDVWAKKGRLIGHYTQMAWAHTYRLGCAVVSCPTMGYVVCHYGPVLYNTSIFLKIFSLQRRISAEQSLSTHTNRNQKCIIS